jgi:outer membrane receptor for ferrienterochelin and colicins
MFMIVRKLALIAAGIAQVLVAAPQADNAAQQTRARLRVQVTTDVGPLANATVTIGTQQAITPASGEVTLTIGVGPVDVVVTREGFLTQTVRVDARAGAETIVVVKLEPQPTAKEEVTVTATRTNTRVQDEPLRVEVLGREEVEEKLQMTPGDIAMLLNETAGLRVQVTSPSLGAASLRVQGLRGRYTQLLADGLPLYGGQSGSIGLLQIPPMDLGQVEIIKGVASSLFGSSALGGVVNLVSRQPPDSAEHEFLFNQTTQGGTDAMLWLSGPMRGHWSYTFLAGGDRQGRHDVDRDGWADIPNVWRGSIRPRFFWNDKQGRSLFVTVGLMAEDRAGGTLPGAQVPDGSTFEESLRTRRGDAGVVSRTAFGKNVVGVRGSFMTQRHTHGFGSVTEPDRHATGFGEISVTSVSGRHTWVIGGTIQGDAYRNKSVPAFDYTYWTSSLFGQDEFTLTSRARVSISARLDRHNVFGTFASPRASVLWSAGGWTARGSIGTGFFAPTPLTEETEAVGLTRLAHADFSRAERARSYSADIGRKIGPVEINVTGFGSHVTRTLAIRPATDLTDRYDLAPLSGPTRTAGAELLTTLRKGEITLVGTYTYVHATEPDPITSVRAEVALTPAHTSGIVLVWEREHTARIGFETYYTGRQRLNDDPYRETSVPYWYFGVMADRRFGPWLLFVNVENLADRRQTRYSPLVRPDRRYDGRWTVDAWAPLEGRVLNAGLRVSF